MNPDSRKILELVESGRLTPQEGASLLGLISEPLESEQAEQSEADSASTESQRNEQTFAARPYWLYPFWAGLAVMLVGAAVVVCAYERGDVTLWTWLLGWTPLLLGLAVVTIALWARRALWIHLRITNQDSRVSLSSPVPLRLTAAVLQVARRFVPQLRQTVADEAILALRDGLKEGNPISIEVSDEAEGEHVQVYVGQMGGQPSRRSTMSLTEERMQILRMIESGQITAEEGAKLLAALRASTKGSAAEGSSAPRWLRLRVTDLRTGRDKVNMNIPISLVDVAMKMGARFVPETDEVDVEEVRAALRAGQPRKILDVEDEEDEERVEIFVE